MAQDSKPAGRRSAPVLDAFLIPGDRIFTPSLDVPSYSPHVIERWVRAGAMMRMRRRSEMRDVGFGIVVLAFFLGCWGLSVLFERLRG